VVALHVSPDITIYGVKEVHCEVEGIPPDWQRLIYAGKQLDDDHTLRYYGVQNEAIIYHVLSLRGC